MIRIPKSAVSFGAVALVAGVVALAFPRAANAVAAALVQVSNTAENPAITQSVPSQASRLVLLSTNLLVNSSTFLFSTGAGPLGLSNYTVPAGQSLVVTSVDITPSVGCGTGWSHSILFGNNSVAASMMWTLPAQSTGHYSYPSGMCSRQALNRRSFLTRQAVLAVAPARRSTLSAT